ncbi:MAG TPA: universal stress protein [Nitrospirota bacterium]|nr:universal stress protein [Nitrospirota bacterium]
MYTRVLAAVNEHVNSEVAARYAKQLAKAAGAKLFLCAIAEPGHPEKDFELAREAVRRVQHAARENGVETEALFDRGDPVERIREFASRQGIDIVIAATRHEDVKHRFYAGPTVARRLLHAVPCSVALVRVVHLGRTHPREVLVPLKGHIDHIPERAYFTAMLARTFDSTVHLFHATQPLKRFFHGEIHLTPLEWEGRLPPDIARFVEHLDHYRVAHEKRLAPGMTGRSITIEAASRRRDLIIMGAGTRSLVDYLVKGNPVEYVLRETPCNLIILKPGK